MEENKYHPFSEEEYKNLSNELAGIGSNLPTHLASFFWPICNRLRREVTPQPCTCASSGGLWKACIDELKEFVKRIEESE